jgi:hypothetical protein
MCLYMCMQRKLRDKNVGSVYAPMENASPYHGYEILFILFIRFVCLSMCNVCLCVCVLHVRVYESVPESTQHVRTPMQLYQHTCLHRNMHPLDHIGQKIRFIITTQARMHVKKGSGEEYSAFYSIRK